MIPGLLGSGIFISDPENNPDTPFFLEKQLLLLNFLSFQLSTVIFFDSSTLFIK